MIYWCWAIHLKRAKVEMFTGIVEEVARVKSIDGPPMSGGTGKLVITASKVFDGVKPGDSISLNGACLTVVHLVDGEFSVDLSPETLKRTNVGVLSPGDGVNLERAIIAGDRLGGHIVQGHVDGTAVVTSIESNRDSSVMVFRAPKKLMPYIVEKGFVAIDGISLTVTKRSALSFGVSVIPYTLKHTILNERRIGDRSNVEVDILAKYVENLLKPK